MGARMISEPVEIINKLGLHARAASKFVKLAQTFASSVELKKGERRANGKSVMGIMLLAASKGTTLQLSIEGEDESEAYQALTALIARRFDEAE